MSLEQSQFGPRLKALRESAGLTQQQLADLIGVKREAIARYERNGSDPGWTVVLAIARALKVSCDAFREDV